MFTRLSMRSGNKPATSRHWTALRVRNLCWVLPACMGVHVAWSDTLEQSGGAAPPTATFELFAPVFEPAPEARPHPPAQPQEQEVAQRGPDREEGGVNRDEPRRRRGWDRDRGRPEAARDDRDRQERRAGSDDRPRRRRDRDFGRELSRRGPMGQGFGGFGPRRPFGRGGFGPGGFGWGDARFAYRDRPGRGWSPWFDGGPGRPGFRERGPGGASQDETNRLLRELVREVDDLRSEIRQLREQRSGAARDFGRGPAWGSRAGGFSPFGGFSRGEFRGFGTPGPRGPWFDRLRDGRRGEERRRPEERGRQGDSDEQRPAEPPERRNAEAGPRADEAA